MSNRRRPERRDAHGAPIRSRHEIMDAVGVVVGVLALTVVLLLIFQHTARRRARWSTPPSSAVVTSSTTTADRDEHRGTPSTVAATSSTPGRPRAPRRQHHDRGVAALGLRGRARLRARSVPAPGARRARRRPVGARRRAHRLGQDARRRVRDPPRARRGRQGLLHDAAQGALEPEVRRLRPRVRQRPRRPAHRRQRGERRRADRGDDHRGAPQHDLRGLADARRPALRRARRGPLPPEPLPRRGVGGGDHPPRARGRPRVPVGDGVERRGVRRLDRDRPRPHHRDHRGAPAGRAHEPLRGGGPRAAATSPAADVRARARRRAAAQPRGRALDARGNERGGRGAGPGRRLVTPRRSELVELLREQSMLPAITFIFSRAACDDAVQQCLAGRAAPHRRRRAPDAPPHRRRPERARSPTRTSTRSATTSG